MRRVLFVLTGLGVGGAERQVMLLARGLSRRGWSVRVAALGPPGTLRAEFESHGIPVHGLGMRPGTPSITALIALAEVFKQFSPDVVHAHMVHANVAARLARMFSRVPRLVCTAHSTREGGRMRDLWYRMTDRLADVTTNVSQRGLQRYVQDRLVDTGRARYVPNGVDLALPRCPQETRSRLRRDLGLGNAFTWICVARLSPVKGHADLLEAFAEHHRRHPGSRLLLAGQGPLEDDLRRRISDLALDATVGLLGNREDVPELLCAADAFVLASLCEGLPMALLEAMSAKLPVVATDVGGIPEVLRLSTVAGLAPPRDSRALAHAMDGIVELPASSRRAETEAVSARITERYALERVLDTWEAIYAGDLGLHHPESGKGTFCIQ